MLFIVDMSMLIHQFFHVRKLDDPYDVTERCLHRLEKMRHLFLAKYPTCSFVAVFDNADRTSYRRIIFQSYKSSRTSDPALREAEQATRQALENDTDWLSVSAPSMFEADDVIATLAMNYLGKVVIHSEDRDYHSLLEEGRVAILKKCNTPSPGAAMEMSWMTAKKLVDEYGFDPPDWLAYQMIIGGKDDVPGWDGVGDKSALLIVALGCDLSGINVDDDILKLNKTQRESYAQFVRDLPTILCCRTLKRDLGWPANVPRTESCAKTA